MFPPNGATLTISSIGINDLVDSDVDPTTGQTVTTTLVPGENDPSWDAGLLASNPLASLGNYIWLDLNANGIQEVDESGLADITVSLYDASSNLLNTMKTDSEGLYLFKNLAPGNYYVQFDRPNSTQYFFSPQGATGSGTDSDANPTTGRAVVTELVAGENDISWDAGIYTPPLLSVTKNAIQASIQPGAQISYTMTYENAGLTTAMDVVITEVVPEHTTWDPQNSSSGWNCQGNQVTAGTICTYIVGDIPAQTRGSLTLTFVVKTNQFLPESVSAIQNEAFISGDGGNLPVIVGQSSGVITVPIKPPTALDATNEPDTGKLIRPLIFVPFVVSSQ